MSAVSESLAVNLKLETGVSMDACNYLNAMTAISNQSMVEFEDCIRCAWNAGAGWGSKRSRCPDLVVPV